MVSEAFGFGFWILAEGGNMDRRSVEWYSQYDSEYS